MPQHPNILLEAHEDRIQKLEEEQSDVKSTIAVLTQRVDAGFKDIGSILEGFRFDFRNHAVEDKATAVKVSEVAERLDSIDLKSKSKADFRASVWKYVWAVILIVLGAAAKFAFDALK